ncbi:MOSC [marine gamma proteobacterium HTCC2143]|jgi:MOSC domain-containing protein YiiM|uniref:MOSC n=1 Tax=marine gamma proteobacterium HTCC2143 TaxID=247633 RepID=A0YEK5_9GAMM|nr:MOSC [marine gamma proteobacterium HTCC2143]
MIEAIFVAKKSKQELQRVNDVQVVFGSGITGDRYFNKAKRPGQNITFIESEAIEAYNTSRNQSISLGETRRNIITKGVDLNALVGVEFSIGNAMFRGVELCEPCRVLGQLLENASLSKTAVIKAFLTSGGLRADVIGSGIVKVGMPIKQS